MSETTSLEMNQEYNGLGKVEIAPEVIEVIASIAASEVEGVAQMRSNFATGVVEKFGKKMHNKGIKVDLSEEGIKVEVYCVMNFGVSIPQVAQQIVRIAYSKYLSDLRVTAFKNPDGSIVIADAVCYGISPKPYFTC